MTEPKVLQGKPRAAIRMADLDAAISAWTERVEKSDKEAEDD